MNIVWWLFTVPVITDCLLCAQIQWRWWSYCVHGTADVNVIEYGMNQETQLGTERWGYFQERGTGQERPVPSGQHLPMLVQTYRSQGKNGAAAVCPSSHLSVVSGVLLMLIPAPFSLSLWPEGRWLSRNPSGSQTGHWGIQPCGLSGYWIFRLLINILSTEFVLPKNLTNAGFVNIECLPCIWSLWTLNVYCEQWVLIVCVVPKNIDCQVGAQNFHEYRIPSVCMIPKTLGTYCVHAPYEQNIYVSLWTPSTWCMYVSYWH